MINCLNTCHKQFKMILFSTIISIYLLNACGQAQTYINPVLNSNHPDPGVLKLPDDSGYALVSTSNYATDESEPVFPLLFSQDLVSWTEMAHVFPAGQWPTWARIDFWAPEIHFVNGNFLIYFTARKSLDNILAIGVAISENASNPFGPYVDLGKPFLEDPLGAIDAHWFFDQRSQRPYFVWKTDNNALGEPSAIFMREMTPDGLDFAPGSEVYEIMRADQPEDVNVVEGASIIFKEPYFYLIFSGNVFDSHLYHANVARSLEVTGPYQRYLGEQFLHTDTDKFENGENCTFVGPGHGTPVRVGEEWWYVYHTWRYGLVNQNPPGRVLNIDRIQWSGDDWPIIGIPSDYETEAPSITRNLL